MIRPGHTALEVFNALGQHVTTLTDQYHLPGQYLASFDGTGLAAGLYFCRLATADMQLQRPMVLVRQ